MENCAGVVQRAGLESADAVTVIPLGKNKAGGEIDLHLYKRSSPLSHLVVR